MGILPEYARLTTPAEVEAWEKKWNERITAMAFYAVNAWRRSRGEPDLWNGDEPEVVMRRTEKLDECMAMIEAGIISQLGNDPNVPGNLYLPADMALRRPRHNPAPV